LIRDARFAGTKAASSVIKKDRLRNERERRDVGPTVASSADREHSGQRPPCNDTGRQADSESGGGEPESLPEHHTKDVRSISACVLSGFRHAARIPAELRPSSTFSLAWAGNLTPYISGVKLAGWIALVLPTLGGLFVWHATVLGTRLAALHLGVGLVVSALLMETLFLRYRLVPFASGYVPSGELRSRGAVPAGPCCLCRLHWRGSSASP
jgi:hypothetical protein